MITVKEDWGTDKVAVLFDHIVDSILFGVLAALGLEVNDDFGTDGDVVAFLNFKRTGSVAGPFIAGKVYEF